MRCRNRPAAVTRMMWGLLAGAMAKVKWISHIQTHRHYDGSCARVNIVDRIMPRMRRHLVTSEYAAALWDSERLVIQFMCFKVCAKRSSSNGSATISVTWNMSIKYPENICMLAMRALFAENTCIYKVYYNQPSMLPNENNTFTTFTPFRCCGYGYSFWFCNDIFDVLRCFVVQQQHRIAVSEVGY